VVQLLLDNGANVNARGREHSNALYAASRRGHEKVVQLLLENGAPEAAAQNQASGSIFGLVPAFTNTAYTAPPAAAAHPVLMAEQVLAALGHEFSTQEQKYHSEWPAEMNTIQYNNPDGGSGL
jgi:hypothetical protein